MLLTPRSARFQDARRRVDALERYRLLDAPPEDFFKRTARMAARLLRTPVARISFVGSDDQWLTWVVGAEDRDLGADASLCLATMTSSGVTAIKDATQSERFHDHPAVTGPLGIRFYAGVPLRTPRGVHIGCLSVMDDTPRLLSASQLSQLKSMAQVVVNELEHRASADGEAPGGRDASPSSESTRESTDAPSLHELGSLLHSSLHQVLLVDRDSLAVLDATPAARRRFDDGERTIRGRSLTDVLHLSEEELNRQLQPVREGTATQVLLRATDETDGRPRPSHYLVLESATGSGSVLVVVALRFSERLQLEARLRQRENVETVRTLVGGIAHNFNNILHSAIVYLQLALEDLDQGPIEFLEHTEEDLHEAAALVSKLQTFARTEGKAVSIPVDLADIAEKAIPLVKPVLPPDARLRTRLEADCTIVGDPAQIEEMVVNLLTNAAEAVGDDDEIELVVERVDVDSTTARQYLHLSPGPHVRLTVRDTGTGMDPEMELHIFEPFYTTKDDPRVVGLGLSVVDGVVRAHEGQIDIESEQDEGTTISVYLPAAEGPSTTNGITE